MSVTHRAVSRTVKAAVEEAIPQSKVYICRVVVVFNYVNTECISGLQQIPVWLDANHQRGINVTHFEPNLVATRAIRFLICPEMAPG